MTEIIISIALIVYYLFLLMIVIMDRHYVPYDFWELIKHLFTYLLLYIAPVILFVLYLVVNHYYKFYIF